MRSILPLLAFCALGLVAATAAPISYQLPEETAAFKPGINLDVVQNNCNGCHSADYIQTQPRNVKSKKDCWVAEVTKMIKVYGAPAAACWRPGSRGRRRRPPRARGGRLHKHSDPRKKPRVTLVSDRETGKLLECAAISDVSGKIPAVV